MQAVADQDAQDLVNALKALGLEGVSVSGRAVPPELHRDRTREGYQTNTTGEWFLKLRVRYRGREIWVERSADDPALPAMTARSLLRLFSGEYSTDDYRSDQQSKRTTPVSMANRRWAAATTVRQDPDGGGTVVAYLRGVRGLSAEERRGRA